MDWLASFGRLYSLNGKDIIPGKHILKENLPVYRTYCLTFFFILHMFILQIVYRYLWAVLWSCSILARLRLQLVMIAAPAPAPAPAPALALVHNLLLKKSSENFHFSIYQACFIHRNVQLLCFALPVLLYLKGQINLIYIFVNIFVISFLLTWGHSWSLSCRAGAAPFFSAPAKKGGSGSTTLLMGCKSTLLGGS